MDTGVTHTRSAAAVRSVTVMVTLTCVTRGVVIRTPGPVSRVSIIQLGSIVRDVRTGIMVMPSKPKTANVSEIFCRSRQAAPTPELELLELGFVVTSIP